MLSRKSPNDNALEDILRTGSRWHHFSALQKGAQWVTTQNDKQRELLSTGTTANEALRAELQRWSTNVVSQHLERIETVCRAFVMKKMLTQNNARPRPTAQQMAPTTILYYMSLTPFSNFDSEIMGLNHDAETRAQLKTPLRTGTDVQKIG